MIDTWSYPPDDMEDQCGFCGEFCDTKLCCKECNKAYEAEN